MLKKTAEILAERVKNLELNNIIHIKTGDRFNSLKELAPYGKFAAIFTAKSFTAFGKDFSERAKLLGFKPLNFILPEDAKLNFSNVFDMIGVPEDIRAIVYFDSDLYGVALYIATLFNVPCAYVMRKPLIGGFFRSRIVFSYEKFSDLFSADCERYLILDDAFIDKTLSDSVYENYVGLFTESLSVADMIACSALYEDNSPRYLRAFSYAKDSIDAVISSPCKKTEDFSDMLFLALSTLSLADFSLGGKILSESAKTSFMRLAGANCDTATLYAFYIRALSLYALACLSSDPLLVPDYLSRADALKELTGKDDGLFLDGFIKQTQAIKTVGTDKTVSAVKDYISLLNDNLINFRDAYINYGGKCVDFTPFNSALKYCGDLPDAFNFMSLVRETGISERIE